MLKTALPFSLALSTLLSAAVASADPERDPNGDHFEATMGFLATAQDHRATGFVPEGAAPQVTETFRGAPYDRTLGLGLRYDVRLVLSNVRMTAGVDLPFASFGELAPVRSEMHDVAPRSMWSWALRFGLGAEYTFGRVTPFADLMGSVHRVTTTLSVDGRPQDYAATRFGFSARAGLRVRLKPWFFIAAAGEVGVMGPTLWSAELSAGFRVGS